MSSAPRPIYRAANVHEANLLVAELDLRGIRALVTGDNTTNIVGGLMNITGGQTPWHFQPLVTVAEEDEEKALHVVEEFEEILHRAGDVQHDPSEEPDDAWHDWPRCEGCGRRRLARCPACEETGTDFPLADYHERGEEVRTLDEEGNAAVAADLHRELPFLLCPHCDETFVAAFYRRCAHCGHDAGNGLEPAVTREPLRMQESALVYVAAMLVGVVALLILAWAWSQRS